MSDGDTSTAGGDDFVRELVRNELSNGVVNRVITRFPPEPNG